MRKNRFFRKALSLMLSAALLGSTIVTGGTGVKADAAEADIVSNQQFTGSATGIATLLKENYYPAEKSGVEVTFKYDEIGSFAADNTIGLNDTIEFTVYDTAWGGWDSTLVGPNGVDKSGNLTAADVELGEEYTVTVPFDTVESKLSTSKPALGIYVQTGGIGTTKVTITSMKYVSGDSFKSQPTVLTGAWHKTSDNNTDFGSISLESGFATAYANAWNIPVSGFSVSTFSKPIVAVTVEYENVPANPAEGQGYYQAEIINPSTDTPIVGNYPRITKDGEVTYLTNIPKTMTSMTLCYDLGTVKKVEIYDEDESYTTAKTTLTNTTITADMGAGWNLGNALDSTSEGRVGETLWGNPEINKRLFKEVAAAGFKTVRIPVTWLEAVTVSDNRVSVDSTKLNEILDRLQEVVDMAMDYDLYVIINIQHDGADGVTGSWLDVDSSNFTAIRTVFSNIWRTIAQRFKDYDQHVIFESMNEVMEKDNYTSDPDQVNDTTWSNINNLNQRFVDTVRGIGGGNSTRFLMVPAYNTNIDQTVSSKFVMPSYNGSKAYEMVSVHFYDPYNFTLNTGSGSTTSATDEELAYICSQFAKLKTTFVDDGIPVFVGEFGAVDKDNIPAIKTYISKIVECAKAKGLAYAYWDNGYTGEHGQALWDRSTYAQTEMGKALIPVLTSAVE